MKTLFIKLRTTGKIHQIPSEEEFKVGQKILIETPQGIELATILEIKRKKPEEEPPGKLLRELTEEDAKKLKDLKPKAEKALLVCQKKIKEFALPMKLIDAEFSLDEKKLTFYFTASQRIDFRELLGELVSHFHKNIRLQQLGPRDAAKMLGGIGPCGRPLCCQTFLEDMDSVTLDMAEAQSLKSVGSGKISGVCGKLICCLAYEAELYQKMRENLPKIGQKIETEKGKGKVVAQNVLRQTVLVELEDGTKIEQRIK
jgi:cell fate regulator YaaT (PSP1 superfamily)